MSLRPKNYNSNNTTHSTQNNSKHPNILTRKGTGLLVIDLQERFKDKIEDFDRIVHKILVLLQAFRKMQLPVAIFEHYPKGLGRTDSRITKAIEDSNLIFEKTTFSSTGAGAFNEWSDENKLKTFVVCGIESHVCVSQTVHDLLHRPADVHIVIDAIASIHTIDFEVSLEKMKLSGAIPSTVQICLFELLDKKEAPEFNAVSALLKSIDNENA